MTSVGLPTVETLSIEQQVAQLIVVRAAGTSFDHQRRYPQWELSNAQLQYCVESLGIGGVILLGGSAVEVGIRTQQLQSWAEVPLLIAADVEEGVGQRFAGATHFPPPMALAGIYQAGSAPAISQACDYARQMGAVTAQEAIAIGLNWLLAPVVDVNNNPDNPVINVRAFGDTPQQVSQLTQAFIQGVQQFPVLTTAKHFPGHGDTIVDSHLQLPVISHDRPRLEAIELAPFRSAIATGVDAVMTAHLQVPALDAQLPATLSPATLTGLLRQALGFTGLVVTDALIMGAIANQYGPDEAAVLALEAGVDVLLMPQDVVGTLQAVCEAVRIGRLSQERIVASVERIWRAKQKVSDRLQVPPESCHAWEQLPPPPVQLDGLATAAARQLITQISQGSMIIQGQLSVFTDEQLPVSLVIVEDVLNTPWLGRTAPAIALPTQQGYQVRLLDAEVCAVPPTALPAAQSPTLLQIFSRGNPFRGTAGLPPATYRWFKFLLAHHCLAGLVVYGSPYVLETLRAELPAQVPYGFSYGQMPSAQAVVLSALLPEPTAEPSKHPFTD